MRWYWGGLFLFFVACKPRYCPDDDASAPPDGGDEYGSRGHHWLECIPRPPKPDGGPSIPPADAAADAQPADAAAPSPDAAPDSGPARPGRVVITLTNVGRVAPYVAFYDTVNPALLDMGGRILYPMREIPLCDGTPYPSWWIRRRPQPGEALVQVWDGSYLELAGPDGGQCWERLYLPPGTYGAMQCYEASFVQLSPWGPEGHPFGECFPITVELPASGDSHLALTFPVPVQ